VPERALKLRRLPLAVDVRQPNRLPERKVALQDLALRMVDHPADVLPHLVDLAIEICSAAVHESVHDAVDGSSTGPSKEHQECLFATRNDTV
jgi:hypothetical protein